MKLRAELAKLIGALGKKNIPYALCGGLAMAAHGWPRSTMDVDILIEPERLDDARQIARDLGYNHEPGQINFANGSIVIHRMVKIADQDVLPLDLLLVSKSLESAWNSREQLETADGPIFVVSPDGLINMKMLRKSGTDIDDIRKLRGEADAPN